MAQDVEDALAVVGNGATHGAIVIQAAHNLSDVKARLHVEVGKSFLRVLENMGILLLQQVHHLPDHPFGRENLIGFLRWNVVEDVFTEAFVEIIGQFLPLLPEHRYGVVEHHLVEEVALKMAHHPVLLIVATVAQEPEILKCDACHLLKDRRRYYLVEVAEPQRAVIVGHDETGNGARKAAQVGTHLILYFVLLPVGAVLFYALYHLARFVLHHLVNLFLQRTGKVVHGLPHVTKEGIVGGPHGNFRIGLPDSFLVFHFRNARLLLIVAAYLVELFANLFDRILCQPARLCTV